MTECITIRAILIRLSKIESLLNNKLRLNIIS